jgi:general stress protein CsbA
MDMLAGSTTNFKVFFDDSLLTTGAALATAVLSTCEADKTTLEGWFNVTIFHTSLPITVKLVQGQYEGSHIGCAGNVITVQVDGVQDADLVRRVVMTEVAEICMVFMTPQVWDCGDSSGEALSRVLSTAQYPNALGSHATAHNWLEMKPRKNFVDNPDPTDGNLEAIGCCALFLNYLHYQLGYTWQQIIAAGAGKDGLGGTYNKLPAHVGYYWELFNDLVNSEYPPGGTYAGVTTDNIFPIYPKPKPFSPLPMRLLASAWMIIVGALLITPAGVFCIACGSEVIATGYIGKEWTVFVAVVSVVTGVVGVADAVKKISSKAAVRE